jgi:4-carboxymuconolactone decarboxylase
MEVKEGMSRGAEEGKARHIASLRGARYYSGILFLRRSTMSTLPESTARLPERKQGDLPTGPFAMLLHSPEVAGRIAHTGAYIRFETTIAAPLRELAILTTARFWDCQYEWTAHQRIAETEAGTRPEAIAAIRDRQAPAGLTDEESVVFNYVSELLNNHRVSDATFKAAHDKFGNQSIVDLTATAGYYSMIASTLNAFNVQPDVGTLPV